MDLPKNVKPDVPPQWGMNLYSLMPGSKMPQKSDSAFQKVVFKMTDARAGLYPMCFMLFAAHVFVISFLFSDEFLSIDTEDEDVTPTAKSLVYYTKRTREKFVEIKNKFSALIPGNTYTNSRNFEQIKQDFSGTKSF